MDIIIHSCASAWQKIRKQDEKMPIPGGWIKNENEDLKSINQEQCEIDFNNFLELHDKEINRLEENDSNISSMGIKKEI